MGDWSSWRDLSPLIDVAKSHAPDAALVALNDASALLAKGKARAADARLAEAANAAGHPWIAVARADLAALYFTLCIRGVAWRLAEGERPHATDRQVDFDESTRLEPGDVSVEALLTNLDAAIASKVPPLVTQARIARARVAAFAERCAANDEVATIAQETAEGDLSILAAEGLLTPDLAYLWAGVQMMRFSGTAAKPFLLQAQAGGFDHPAVTFMLATIAFEERELDQAEALAKAAVELYAPLEQPDSSAQAWFLLGEIARARGSNDPKHREDARVSYAQALELSPTYVPAVFALARLALDGGDETKALDRLHANIGTLLLGTEALDADRLRQAAENLETFVIMAEEPVLVQLARDALLWKIGTEQDPARRGLRYFFAATLDARMQEFEFAHGHGALAKAEFATAEIEPPMDLQAFLDRVRP